MKKVRLSFASCIVIPAVILFIVIAITVSMVISNRYTTMIWDRKIAETEASLDISVNQIAQVMKSASTAARTIRENEAVASYLLDGHYSAGDEMSARMYAIQKMNSYLASSSSLQGIFFISSDGSVTGINKNNTYFERESAELFLNNPRIMQSGYNQSIYWMAPYQLNDISAKAHMDISMENTLIMCVMTEKYTYSYDKNEKTLVTIGAVDINELLSCCSYLCESGDAVYLVNGSGECILSVGAEWCNGTIDYYDLVKSEKGSVKQENENGLLDYVIYKKLPINNWYLIKVMQTEAYVENLRQINRNVLLISFAFAGMMIMLYIIWSRYVNSSLKKLNEGMNRVKNGNLSLRIEEPMLVREYDDIRKQFNQMQSSIQELIQVTRKIEHERGEMEAQALKTQLSPHMIFNSISSIRWMATVMGVEQISQMLAALAELLKPAFRETRLLWTMTDELDNLGNYLTLLKLRYGDQLCLETDIPDDLKETMVPCFILQPILENSFEHRTVERDILLISISAFANEEGTTIRITDNGGGMKPEQLNRLRDELNNQNNTTNSVPKIGLRNASRKLQLLCGGRSRLFVNSISGESTTIEIFIDNVG